ncbi:MAG TPA: Nex18 symbiotically induced protein [Alphaproteobacteria bacterium]|nr:Nex18 symbiotically induced protein [Alphaproteobacteria bacterium]HAJ45368.1 Nex18 symbiotically induced protein [Alphaproteobacteria bacterium]
MSLIAKLAGFALAASLLIAPANAGGAKKDIVDTAAGDARFSTLVAAVKAAGLVETLKGPGPFTVFAPTNDAFAKLPAGTVDNLLKPENKDKLVGILTYHVLAGKTKSTDLAGKTLDAKTVQGATVKVDGTKGVKVNDATVIVADVYTSNGVIHAIDTVLLPPAK